MRRRHRFLLSFAAAVLLTTGIPSTGTAALNMSAAVKVSGGGTYDYFIIGMQSAATDYFDNAFDTLASTGSMNDRYIYTYFSHPEWGSVKSEFRGDVRSSLNRHQEWMLKIDTNLRSGTTMTMTLMQDRTNIPPGYSVVIVDPITGAQFGIESLPYSFKLPSNSAARYIRIIADAPLTYNVSGSVKDSNGNSIAGAHIQLSNNIVGEVEATSDASGNFAIADMIDGTYVVLASASGFEFDQNSVTVSGGNANINISANELVVQDDADGEGGSAGNEGGDGGQGDDQQNASGNDGATGGVPYSPGDTGDSGETITSYSGEQNSSSDNGQAYSNTANASNMVGVFASDTRSSPSGRTKIFTPPSAPDHLSQQPAANRKSRKSVKLTADKSGSRADRQKSRPVEKTICKTFRDASGGKITYCGKDIPDEAIMARAGTNGLAAVKPRPDGRKSRNINVSSIKGLEKYVDWGLDIGMLRTATLTLKEKAEGLFRPSIFSRSGSGIGYHLLVRGVYM